jgi:hypothetical protein
VEFLLAFSFLLLFFGAIGVLVLVTAIVLFALAPLAAGLVLTNRSAIPYEADFIRFSLRDRKKLRRTATQEEALSPRYTYGRQHQPVPVRRNRSAL